MVSGGFLWVSETFVARLHGLLLISYGRWVSYRFPAVSSGVPTRLIVLRVSMGFSPVCNRFPCGFLWPYGFPRGFRWVPAVSTGFS